MTDYAIKDSLSLTAKGQRWLLSKLEKDDPLRVKVIDMLLAAGEPLHVEGENDCTPWGKHILTCNKPKCRAKHKAALKRIAERYEMCGNHERAARYWEEWRKR